MHATAKGWTFGGQFTLLARNLAYSWHEPASEVGTSLASSQQHDDAKEL
jgi:hypothetical protein